MQLTLKTIIPLAAIFLYVLLLIVVFASKPQNDLRIRFRFYLMAMVVWSVAAFIVLQDLGHTLFWFRLMTSSALASMIALFYFTQAAVIKKIKFAQYIFLYGLAAILINQFTEFTTPYAEIINGELVYEFSQSIAFVAGPAYLVMLFSIFQLLWNTRTTKDETQYSRYSLFAVAIIIILIGGSLNFTELGKYPIDIIANIIAALIITYAILRHQLLDIKSCNSQKPFICDPDNICWCDLFSFHQSGFAGLQFKCQREPVFPVIDRFDFCSSSGSAI